MQLVRIWGPMPRPKWRKNCHLLEKYGNYPLALPSFTQLSNRGFVSLFLCFFALRSETHNLTPMHRIHWRCSRNIECCRGLCLQWTAVVRVQDLYANLNRIIPGRWMQMELGLRLFITTKHALETCGFEVSSFDPYP